VSITVVLLGYELELRLTALRYPVDGLIATGLWFLGPVELRTWSGVR
jgi:hypothetical protein